MYFDVLIFTKCFHVRYFLQNGDGGGDDDWSADVTEDAVKARIEDLAGHVTNITLTSDLEKTMVDRVDSFYKLVEVRGIIDNLWYLQFILPYLHMYV